MTDTHNTDALAAAVMSLSSPSPQPRKPRKAMTEQALRQVAEVRQRKRAAGEAALRNWPEVKREHVAAPTVSPTLLIDGRLAVRVALTGPAGEGREMTLDLADWERVKRALGERWGLRTVKGCSYVVQRGGGARGGLVLARWIVGAEKGEVVSYMNSDRLDLRRRNLATTLRVEFVAGVFGHARVGGG